MLHLRPGVREHFMSWLGANRPDLVPEYERRYRGRSYLPGKEQSAISELVHAAVRKAGGLAVPPRATRLTPVEEVRPVVSAPTIETTQLGLAI